MLDEPAAQNNVDAENQQPPAALFLNGDGLTTSHVGRTATTTTTNTTTTTRQAALKKKGGKKLRQATCCPPRLQHLLHHHHHHHHQHHSVQTRSARNHLHPPHGNQNNNNNNNNVSGCGAIAALAGPRAATTALSTSTRATIASQARATTVSSTKATIACPQARATTVLSGTRATTVLSGTRATIGCQARATTVSSTRANIASTRDTKVLSGTRASITVQQTNTEPAAQPSAAPHHLIKLGNNKKELLKSKGVRCERVVTPPGVKHDHLSQNRNSRSHRSKHSPTAPSSALSLKRKDASTPQKLPYSTPKTPLRSADNVKMEVVSPTGHVSQEEGEKIYAGAKFSEPPSPSVLPKPPSHWVGENAPQSGDRSREQMTVHLKSLLKVEGKA